MHRTLAHVAQRRLVPKIRDEGVIPASEITALSRTRCSILHSAALIRDIVCGTVTRPANKIPYLRRITGVALHRARDNEQLRGWCPFDGKQDPNRAMAKPSATARPAPVRRVPGLLWLLRNATLGLFTNKRKEAAPWLLGRRFYW